MASRNTNSSTELNFVDKFWASNRLRESMDNAEYKNAVLGSIFLKYISDMFEKKNSNRNLRRWKR